MPADIAQRVRKSQEKILVLSATQSFASAVAAIDAAQAEWVVIVREEEWLNEPYLYAFRPDEIFPQSLDSPPSATLLATLDLHEDDRSEVSTEGSSSTAPPTGIRAPSAQRVITLDPDGAPLAVREQVRLRSGDGTRGIFEAATPGAPSAAAPSAPAPGRELQEMRLTAQAPARLAPGDENIIDVAIAAPGGISLPGAVVTRGSTVESIAIILTILGDAVIATGPRILRLDPPKPKTTSQTAFEIRAVRAGTVQIAVIFRQGGSELGSIRAQIQVGPEASSERTTGESEGAPRTPDDGGVLLLQVEPRKAGGEIRYQYRVHCPRLGLDFAEFESPRLLAKDGSAALSELAFVQRLYSSLTNQTLRTPSQVSRFSQEIEAFAEDLGAQLFPPELIRLLWEGRDKIESVRVMSWEPYIPWELIKLAIPKEQKSDDRFLSQYGMVRWLAGRSATRDLSLAQWSYYAATYPNNPSQDVTREVSYFKTLLPQRGIQAVQVASTYDAFVAALQNPTFDVLHVACHGDVKEDNIEKAELVITDEMVNGRPKFVSISANVVGKVARFGNRHPLIFLNACEAGRLGESLTTWGGWPMRLINAGAGAVVGASWPVRDVASNKFATAFYDALLDQKSLCTAATLARTAAAEVGDATWLSFKVFGDPHARSS